MAFQVPFSSSPPSTPDRRSSNIFSYGANPSTTPAGPPPSSAGSFTPAGPPPPSAFGSSMGTPLKPLSFSQQTAFNPNSSPPNFLRSAVQSAAPGQRSGLSHEYQSSPQRSFRAPSEDSEGGEGDEYMDEEDDGQYNESQQSYAEDEDADRMADDNARYEEDADMHDYRSGFQDSRAIGRGFGERSTADLLRSTPGGLKRSREGGAPGLNSSIMQSASVPEPSYFESIAKDLSSRMPQPQLKEADDLILKTEVTIERLFSDGIGATEDDDLLEETLTTVSGELVRLWEDYQNKIAVYDSDEYTAGIGPGSKASDFEKANFLAGLALKIQHPGKISKSFDRKVVPLPQVLLEWMHDYHNPYPSSLDVVQNNLPSPSNHRSFWDTAFSCLVRGKVAAVKHLLEHAGWSTARNETETSLSQFGQVGFTGPALANVEKVVGAATHVLSQCPAVHGDWNTKSSDWTLFRLHVSQALEELRTFAEGNNRERMGSLYEPEGFGASSIASTYSKNAKKAESKVPWHIYQNLITLYNLVMGDSNAIIENAQDWCEATIGLLVWWDEGRDDRRVALGRSQSNYRVASRESDAVSYRRKLRRSFQIATADTTDFKVNSADMVEVGLVTLFEGNVEAVVGFLKGWSGPLSSAVAEIASLGGWLPPAEEKNLINMGSFDQDDLDLLGYNSSPPREDGVKDKTLIAYARLLAKRGPMKASTSSGQTIAREGWEIAIAVLGRLDSTDRQVEMIGLFLNGFKLDSSSTVDKLWRLLTDLDLTRHAERIAESYADTLAEGSHRYGEALWYYALSHKVQKVKDVLDLLISFSLIQSTAYPPEPELDDFLRSLVSSPKDALTKISEMDDEAAALLHKMLSGYATLRKFYNLRDEDVSHTGAKSHLGPIARKVEATSSLLAVITSSDDNIRGGLYDEERGAVVSVDFLLALLGEALVLVNQTDSAITVSQIDVLLKAIEDLETVGERVNSVCSEFLQTVIASAQGLKGSAPMDMLRKSTSNISGTSSFSMVGSSMYASQLKQSMSSSGVLVKGDSKRGWDWRQGVSASTKGEDLLRILRLGLAKDLAKAYLLESDSRI
ncbi:hypothetical protein ONS95_004036 [Cadophora gregata]|uniref:uncharacterized protein n=1 Tax=Cadophora gregata TaxID=51156 RepID=UPI0026DC9CF2|nr:uncharacterized protein ONS95_004036 [Cadophora gregata]KAK0107343.1 hypothetical protein ONS95_004036 [Cadophora gregata]KAK0117022.1 hypothetical protein ONS96_012864 [Cadophora gregata f. sp. sojae]